MDSVLFILCQPRVVLRGLFVINDDRCSGWNIPLIKTTTARISLNKLKWMRLELEPLFIPRVSDMLTDVALVEDSLLAIVKLESDGTITRLRY
jgi:hypothetical protein